MTRCFTSRLTLSPGNLISGKKVFKKTRQRFPKLPPALPNSFTLPYVIHVLVGEYQPHSLTRYVGKPSCAEHHCLLGSTNQCPTDVHMRIRKCKMKQARMHPHPSSRAMFNKHPQQLFVPSSGFAKTFATGNSWLQQDTVRG